MAISTYTMNGFDLDALLGIHLAESVARVGINKNASSLTGVGRDGNTPVPNPEVSPLLPLKARIPFAAEQAFLALLDSPVLTLGHDGLEAVVELMGSPATALNVATVEYEMVFRFPDLFWRDPAVQTPAAASITSGSQVVSFFAASRLRFVTRSFG
jgi:hypothetical protein